LVAAAVSVATAEGLTALTPSFLLSLLLVVGVVAITHRVLEGLVVAQGVAALGRAARAALAPRAKAITVVQVNPSLVIGMVVAAAAAVLVL
jgi:hypothetical protein